MEDGIKEHANVQRGLYQVTDKFFRFWYAFVFPHLSELEAGDSEGVWNYIVKPELDNYTSHVFEEICREYLREKSKEQQLPFRFVKIGRWWNKTDELDVMAVDKATKQYIIGECKYKNSPSAMSDLRQMQEKFLPKTQDVALFYWLFSKSGFTKYVLEEAKR